MKKEFSTAWKSSKQPRKQRKYRANAPMHIQRSFLSVTLSKALRSKHGRRNVTVRKGDKVKVLRGKFKKKEGKVLEIKGLRVSLEGVQVKKRDGSTVNVCLQPSNLQITELNLEDKKRAQKLGGKAMQKKEETKDVKKTEKVKEEKKEKAKSQPKEVNKEKKE